ncbi:hypothetical protein [Pseudophaeobacter sp.]|uniref:hypothetical protein n=1 Tax=Pseudophaeobacter sp. TaxID=1971739 RepID=UPI003296D2D5
MNSEIKSLRRLNEGQYSSIGRTVSLLTAIEYELFRTISAVAGVTEKETTKAARGTFDQRKTMLREKLTGSTRINSNSLNTLFSKLDVASELRSQFAHGLWAAEDGQLVCKFIKRHNRVDATNQIALQTIQMPSEKFELIHRNLEYILIELDVIQKQLGES